MHGRKRFAFSCALVFSIVSCLLLLMLNLGAEIFAGVSFPEVVSTWWTFSHFPTYPSRIIDISGGVYQIGNTPPEEVVRFYKTRFSDPQWRIVNEQWYVPTVSAPDYPHVPHYCAAIEYHPFGPILENRVILRVVSIIGLDKVTRKDIVTGDTAVFIYPGYFAKNAENYVPCKFTASMYLPHAANESITQRTP